MKSQSSQRGKPSARTTIRVQPTKAQVWQAIKLVQFLGGDPTGKSNQWVFQVLFDSLITQHLKRGDIQAITNENAEEEIRKFKSRDLPEGTSIETLEEIQRIENETSKSSKAQNEFADDLSRAIADQDMEGIGDLFDLEGFNDSQE